MPLFTPDVPDLVTYQTEAELDAATEGELALALIDTEVNWPTLWT